MSSKRPSLPERIKKGLREAIQHERGEITLRTREVYLAATPEPAPADHCDLRDVGN